MNQETALHTCTGAAKADGNYVAVPRVTGTSIRREFKAALSDALTSGMGSLVDADIRGAATRLQALQAHALSIANDDARSILCLFG